MPCRSGQESGILARACFFYYGKIAELIRQYKHSGDWGLMSFFADQLFHCYTQHFAPLPLIPIASNPLSRKKRGFDPVHRIAFHLEKKYGLTVHYLFQRLPGTSQKTLSAAARSNNLAGQFSIRMKAMIPLEGVLLDDVRTTGSTAGECARLLRKHGARTCYLLSISLPFPA